MESAHHVFIVVSTGARVPWRTLGVDKDGDFEQMAMIKDLRGKYPDLLTITFDEAGTSNTDPKDAELWAEMEKLTKGGAYFKATGAQKTKLYHDFAELLVETRWFTRYVGSVQGCLKNAL
eukprot:TRINITY_DN28728_c0_g1_i1.p2 TRINITY_DN28728_c0_g1~~TRINITY_DN28728_c0_g1_i1.p2  ORF type:complete len:120 (-),score=19.73 TRINITY_DN28728_c0_g1_i1:81-440(-)